MKTYTSNTHSAPIKAGTTILTEKPFVFILSSKENGQRCDHCFTKGKVLKCSGCQHIHYCGRCCQKEAWAEHKSECVGFRRCAPRVPPDAARLLARLVRKLAAGGQHTRGHYSDKGFRVWKDLMSHYQELKMDARRMEHFTMLCTILFQFLHDISIPNSVELMGIYGRMIVNGFTILDPEMLTIGTGVYLGTSILDHRCEPNAVATFQGTTITIKTIVDLPALDWSKVFISYIDLLNSPFDRQSELEATYYFLCQCERCLDKYQISLMHAAKCPNPECDFPVQIPWREDIKLVKLADQSESEDAQNGCQEAGPEKQNGGHKKSFRQQVENSRRGPGMNGHACNGDDERCTNGYGNCSSYDAGLSNGLQGLSLEDDLELSCPSCGQHISEQFALRFREVMDFTHMHLQNMKDKSTTYVDVCRACLEKQQGVLHPLCLLRVQTLDLAMDGCLQYQLWEHARHYAQQLLPGFRNYYGPLHPMYGLLLVKLGKLELFAGHPREAMDNFKAAQDVLYITHGPQHALCRESLAPLMRQAREEADAILKF